MNATGLSPPELEQGVHAHRRPSVLAPGQGERKNAGFSYGKWGLL